MRPVLGASLSVIPRVDGMEYGGERRRWDGEEETIREGVKPKGMQCPSLYRLSVRGYKTFCPYANTLEVSNDEKLRNSFPRMLRKEFRDVVECPT